MKKAITAILFGYFLALLWVIAADIFYHNQVSVNDVQFHGLYPISLGVSALLVAWFFDGNLKAIHFRKCSWKYIWLGLLLAVTVFIPFIINIAFGIVHFGSFSSIDPFLSVIGIPVLILFAIGEEVMWRGLLYTEFMKRFSFIVTGLITGALWALWHFPVIIHTHFLYAEYPFWYSLPMFTIGIYGMTCFTMYLRAASNSIWPAVIWHAFVNFFSFVIIQPLEIPNGDSSLYFKVDIGIFYTITYVVVGMVYFFKLKSLENREQKMENRK